MVESGHKSKKGHSNAGAQEEEKKVTSPTSSNVQRSVTSGSNKRPKRPRAPYQAIRVIGRGSFGIVYEAHFHVEGEEE